MNPVLKPCPFCGEQPDSGPTIAKTWRITCISGACSKDHSHFIFFDRETQQDAEEAWNQRVDKL